ncbi:MAG: histidinol dehydrogenase [Spirochaetales bacterium]|nr:MAG: histidinol dehydrogenase [Spirochaetales bacterium]
MQLTIRDWRNMSREEKDRLLLRSEQDIRDVSSGVKNILEEVRTGGDAALVRLEARFDKADISRLPLEIGEPEYTEAERSLSRELKDALRYAIENVRRFHKSQVPSALQFSEVRPGIFAGEKANPVPSAGLYVPRGKGSFPSMLYMTAVPAALAGVERIVVVTPPNPGGSVDAACLYAAKISGVHAVYRIGGAQAIAALAYGTESIPKVAKIIGPGSAYVAAAKRLLQGIVDTGLPAGPSESVILADGTADPNLVALDLLIEAEHGPDSSALLITPSAKLAQETAKLLPGLADMLPEPRRGYVKEVFSRYGGIILAGSMEEAADIVNLFAPEHLQIQASDPKALLPLIRNAGEILLGSSTPFSAANYAAGPNAVLPTGGMARTWSPVSVRDFMKFSSVIEITAEGLKGMAPHVKALAEYEDFPAHKNAFTGRGL